MAGKFSNSKLVHAGNFEAPFLGGAATYDGETVYFLQNTSSPDIPGGVGPTPTSESVVSSQHTGSLKFCNVGQFAEKT